MNILEKIKKHHQQNLPFVAYRKPNKTFVSVFLQETNALFSVESYKKSGFVFAPFNNKESAVLIPEKHSKFLYEELIIDDKFTFKKEFSDDFPSKENHIQLVKNAIKAINKGEFKKVVVSRKENVQLSDFDLITVFVKLLNSYPNAMVYAWFHPKVGLWLGATPETLLKVKDNQFETMALAGTKTYKGTTDVAWQQKETEEQQFVTDYITSNLRPHVKKLVVSKVETVKAGNLLHLRTKISGGLETNNLELLTKLHPTPAVCGLPLKESKEFILKNENYNRSYYTGFLGELNLTTNLQPISSNLYVNLRCMEIKENKAIIYVGGGITKDSNPTKEWEETVVKTRVMKQVL